MSQSARHPFLDSSDPLRIGAGRLFRELVLAGPRVAWFDCGALLLLAGAIRAIGLPGLSLWADDFFTVYWSQLPLDFLFGQGAQTETNPPFFYAFMHMWIALFGDSPLSVYLPGVLASAGAVPLVYLTGALLFDRKTALLAGLIAAIDPFMVMYAQQVRGYALLAFCNGGAMLALAAYLQRRAAGVGLVTWRVLFVAAVSAGVFVHYTALLFLAACFLVVALELLMAPPARWQYLAAWGGAAAAAAACIALPAWQAAHLTASPNIAWIPPLSLADTRYFATSVLLDPVMRMGWQSCALCGVLGLVLVSAGWQVRRARAQMLVLVVLPLLYCAILFAITAVRPILLPRFVVWLAMPLCILLAVGVMRQRGWIRAVAGLAVLAVWLFTLWGYVTAPGKEDWQLAARIAANQPGCSGPVVTFNTDALGLIYYQPALAQRPLFAIPMQVSARGYVAEPINGLQQDVLERNYLHSDFMYLRQVPPFVAARPHTILVMRPNYAPLLRVVPRPVLAGVLPGGLVVACY